MPARGPELPSKRVEADLRRRVSAGEWQCDEKLPSVAVLAGEYGVARSTVVSALRRMQDDGLVEIVANWGTFRRLSAELRVPGTANPAWLSDAVLGQIKPNLVASGP